jgi:endonuclease-8
MPEGDTIWRAAAQLRVALAGKQVRRVRPGGLHRLVGSTVTSVEPAGKHIVMRFDNGYALHSHMRMRGVWHVYRPSEKWTRPDWQLKALIETDDMIAVCFGAPTVELLRNVAERIGHLGPDVLADDWNPTDVIKRARQLNQTSVGELLLDQRVTSGIGNVYRCEALWHERINPWTRTEQLRDERLAKLFETARAAMRVNLATDARRRTFPGYGRGAVHGRGGRPCPRCGALIQVKLMGENPRLVYWCPRCQPASG